MRTLYGANKAQRIAARFIPKDSRKVALKDGSATVYLYQQRERFLAVMYRGTAAKAENHTLYRTEEQRAKAVSEFFKSVQASQQFRAQQRAERAKPNTLKVGDIVYTSWGYDQTNTDFYAIVRVSGRCVWVRPIASDYEATGHMCGNCWPSMPIRYTGEESKHIVQHGNCLSINGHGASLETGRSHYSSSYA